MCHRALFSRLSLTGPCCHGDISAELEKEGIALMGWKSLKFARKLPRTLYFFFLITVSFIFLSDGHFFDEEKVRFNERLL